MTASISDLGYRRWTAQLFDQQMWCLGRDIVHPRGNVLLDWGMCQNHASDPRRGSTRYTAAIEPCGSIFLWGFGAMYAEPGVGNVFVRRYDFAPRLALCPSGQNVHDPEQLGRLVNPSTRREWCLMQRLLPIFIGWFAKYEHWIAEKMGTTYRENCLAARSNKPVAVAAKGMAHAWERAAKHACRLSVNTDRRFNPWGCQIERLRAGIVLSGSNHPTYRPPIRVN